MKIFIRYLIIFVTLLSGYASANSKSIETDIAVELISSRQVIVKTANINNKNEGITLSGRLKRRFATNSWRLPGHIDVEILDAEGTVIYKSKARYLKKSHLRNIRNFKYEYSIDIPFIPSDENVIRVSFHEK